MGADEEGEHSRGGPAEPTPLLTNRSIAPNPPVAGASPSATHAASLDAASPGAASPGAASLEKGQPTQCLVDDGDDANAADVPESPRAGWMLSATMFLQHFALGAWVVTLGSYLKANSGDSGTGIFTVGFVGVAYGASSFGAMVAPLLTGILADVYLRANRVAATLSLAAAVILWGTAGARTQATFFAGLIAFFVCFMPTVSLVTAMILRRLPDPDRQFPRIRAWGTVGWVAAGIVVGALAPWVTGQSIELTSAPMRIGAVALAALAALCMAMPSVRRAPGPRAAFRWNEVRLLAGRPGVWRLLAIGWFASIPAQFYYNYGNVYLNALEIPLAAAKLTLGQVAEVGGMLALPVVLRRLGARQVVMIGLATWAVRYGLLASIDGPGQEIRVFLAVLLHGIAFTWTSIPLQLEMHRRAGSAFRATGQGLLLIAMSGLGTLSGARLAGWSEVWWLADQTLGDGSAFGAGWRAFWSLPAIVASVVFVVVYSLWGKSGATGAEKSTKLAKNAGIGEGAGYTQR